MEAESFVLLSVENREILGVEPSQINPEAAIVTVQNQGVYIYDIFDQQCKTSYLLAPGNAFTHHAIQNPNTKKFLAVKENKYICTWPEEQKDLKKIGRKAYDRGDIHSIFVDKFLGTHHLIIFADGSLSLGNPDLALLTNPEGSATPTATTGEVVWTSMRHADSILFVAVVTKASNDNYTLHIHSITRPEKALELQHLSSHKLTKPAKSKLLTCSFDADALAFTTIWSNGDLIVSAASSAEDLTNVNDSFTTTVTRKIKLPKAVTQAGFGLVSACIKPNLVFLSQPCETAKNKQNITVWDTTFGVVQSTKDISTDAESQTSGGILASAESQNLLAKQVSQSADGSLVFINLKSMVVVCPIWAPASSLANSLGALENSKPFLAAAVPATSESSFNWIAPVLEGASPVAPTSGESGTNISNLDQIWQDHAVARAQAEANAIAQLTNKQKTPTFEAFMQTFNVFLKDSKAMAVAHAEFMEQMFSKEGHKQTYRNLAEMSAQQQKKQKKKELVASMQSKRAVVLSHNFVYQVALRCLEEDFLWEPLRTLIESKALSVRSLTTLIPTLMDKNQMSLLVDVLENVSDLSESDIVTISKYFMSQADAENLQICVDECIAHRGKKTDDDNMEKSTSPSSDEFPQTALEKILNVIVSAPFNSLFMTQAARRFKLDELVVLMRFLLRWLKFYKETTQSVSMSNTNIAIPSLAVIVSWASLLVDSQMSQMLLADECRQLVLDLQHAVADHISLCDALEALRGVLAQYHARGVFSRRQETDYTIETLS